MGKIWHTGHSDSSRIAEREGCTAWVGSSVSHPDPARFGRSNYWLLHNLRLMPNFYWNRFIQKCVIGSVYKYIKNNSYSRDYEN